MSYELFLQGPAAYIPVILISLVITMVAYGAFPLIFAKTRKKVITKRKYTVLCYCANFLVNLLFIVIKDNPSSGGPYLIWTWIFSASGINELKRRGVLEGFQPADRVVESKITYGVDVNPESSTVVEERPPIRFCRKCGFELIVGSEFCSRCGTAVIRE